MNSQVWAKSSAPGPDTLPTCERHSPALGGVAWHNSTQVSAVSKWLLTRDEEQSLHNSNRRPLPAVLPESRKGGCTSSSLPPLPTQTKGSTKPWQSWASHILKLLPRCAESLIRLLELHLSSFRVHRASFWKNPRVGPAGPGHITQAPFRTGRKQGARGAPCLPQQQVTLYPEAGPCSEQGSNGNKQRLWAHRAVCQV